MNSHTHPEYDGKVPTVPRSGQVFAAVCLLMIAALVCSVVWTSVSHGATTTTRHMYVHTVHGSWAWEPANHPRQIVAPRASTAGHKMLAAMPGDTFRLRGESRGAFTVTGIIDIGVAEMARPFYDRRMHPGGTSRYLFLDRVAKP